MVYRFEDKPAFTVAGLSMEGRAGSDFPRLWDDLMKIASDQVMAKLGSGETYGLCHGYFADGSFTYMAGFDVADKDQARNLGLEFLTVQAASYIVVDLVGSVPDSIRKGWTWLMEEYFPDSPYLHAGTPDFEYYLGKDSSTPDYRMELWVPIAEKPHI